MSFVLSQPNAVDPRRRSPLPTGNPHHDPTRTDGNREPEGGRHGNEAARRGDDTETAVNTEVASASTGQSVEGEMRPGSVDFRGVQRPQGEGGIRREGGGDGATKDGTAPLGGAGVRNGGEARDGLPRKGTPTICKGKIKGDGRLGGGVAEEAVK